ncbi:DNA translocase FtsK [Thiomicrospira cyclica]|uniref:DNA translocase FtsK n=1 Tax=Thiomicrospira cyclica (strain DSM 14477 / JCM 11371 / ALM1) TaxID=717773 RepID=F6DD14_THICA|nr:DNA translocase FtsK [Thiomicrospira cyclica]AEG31750.1 cell division protein FtsK/SpoIIIE [Thiomicrospira cyclica ALM1]
MVSATNASRSSEQAKPTHWLLKDVIFIAGITLALFILLVLYSYDPNDLGFQQAGQSGVVLNFGGATGAWLSSILFYVFGIFAFAWSLGLLVISWLVLRNRRNDEFDIARIALSLVGVVLVVVSGSALASLFVSPDATWVALPFYAGGVVGFELSKFLVSQFDLLATTLLLIALMAVGFSLALARSWLSIFEQTGSGFWQSVGWLKPRLAGMASYLLTQQKRIPWRAIAQGFTAKLQQAAFSAQGRIKKMTSAHDAVSASVTLSASGEGQTKLVRKPPLIKTLASVDAQQDSDVVTDVAVKKSFDFGSLKDVAKGLRTPSLFGDDAKSPEMADSPPKTQKMPTLGDTADLAANAKHKPQQLGDLSELAVQDTPAVSPQSIETTPVAPAQTALAPMTSNDYQVPGVDLLDPARVYKDRYTAEQLLDLSKLLETRLLEFGVTATVEAVLPGPVVTRFELMPAPGVKVSQINNLAKDLARAMSVQSVRVVDVIPGKPYVGIEIPNENREIVSFKDVLKSPAFQDSDALLTLGLGKDIEGQPVVANLAKMPHLLVAGTTGSGKSVGVNSMIISMLLKGRPDQIKFIMIDPKMLELSIYGDIPHLLTPVVTDMSDAANALRWCVFEMDRRYQLMAKMGVRNIAGFNEKVQAAIDAGQPIIDPLFEQAANHGMAIADEAPTLTPLPFIVVIIDEFADMIMVVGKKVEELIARLAQKARASGIHLVLATQRPSVNVITGLIKANVPTRISFQVSSKIDSRTILDQMGAESLLGMGDMLYLPPGSGSPLRVHGAFVSDDEVHRVVDFIKQQGAPQYLPEITHDHENGGSAVSSNGAGSDDAESDPLYDEVVAFVIEGGRVSISMVQRRFKIGYNRAARIVEAMEAAGVVSTMQANGVREVLTPRHD